MARRFKERVAEVEVVETTEARLTFFTREIAKLGPLNYDREVKRVAATV